MKRITILILSAFLFIAAVPVSGEATATAAGDTFYSSYTSEELLALWTQVSDLLRADGAYPYVELEKGDTGYEVAALQTRLTELGYYQKEIVDNFGNGTYSAMRAFEKDYGLTVDGVASVSDQQLLFGGTVSAGTAASSSTGGTDSNARDAVSGATSNKP